ncbi:MAG TPA: thiamine pyrophosphate-dependent enzyme [Polyangiaceae bacterium]
MLQEVKTQDDSLAIWTSLVRMRAFAAADLAARTDPFERHVAPAELAVIAGAMAALKKDDGAFPSDVDAASVLARGVSMTDLVARKIGWKSLKMSPPGWHNGAHLVHAAGFAWAAKMKKEDAVALALGPEDVMETGEVHNALNFAGVFKLPAIFVVRAKPAAEAELRARALEYGITVTAADGSDVLAVREVVREARVRAAKGNGATLVAALLDPASKTDAANALRKHVEAQKSATASELDAIVANAKKEAESAFRA